MVKRKWVVIFEHPHYPEIYLFESHVAANTKYEELLEENHREDGHNDGYLYVGEMVGMFTPVKTYY